MSRFEIKTIVPNWNGTSAGIQFANGRAVITSDTAAGLAALSYFKQAGYGIAPLDSEGPDEILARANEDPNAEHARLTAEIVAKENRLKLGELRDRSKALDEKIFSADAKAAEKNGDEAQPGAPKTTQADLLAPPADSAGVAEWRKWAVESGRATEAEAKALDKNAVIAQHGSAYDAERDAQLKAAVAAEQGVA
jgi:hypothetical protein